MAGQLALRLVSGLETSLPPLCVGTRRDPWGARARAELPRVGCPPGPLAEGPWGCLCATRVGSCGHGMAALPARPCCARVRVAALLLHRMEIWAQGARGGGAARWGLHPAGLCWVLPGCRLHPHAPGRCRTPSEPSTSPVLLIVAMRASLLNSQGDQWSFFSPAFTLLRGAAGFAIPPSRRSHPGAVRGGAPALP